MTETVDLDKPLELDDGTSFRVPPDLIERVERAEWPDSELDADVFQILKGRRCRKIYLVPRYTASVDAVLALISERLPGWRVCELRQLTEYRGGVSKGVMWEAALHEMNNLRMAFDYAEVEAATPALALLAAALRAIAAEEDVR